MIENRAELVMESLKVNRRVRLTVFILVVQHFVLSGDNLLGGDITHFQLAEVRNQFGTDDMILGSPSVLLEPGFHICRIEIH